MDTVVTLQGEELFLGLAAKSATGSAIADVLRFPLIEGVVGAGLFAPKKDFVLAEFFTRANSGLDEIAIKIAKQFVFGRPAPDRILDSDLSTAGKRVAYRIRSLVHGAAPGLVEEITTTDDGGLTMEYTSERTGREITFVLPTDGNVRYFVARARGVRYAGIVLTDDALGQMALWATQERPFPERGLAIGKSSTRHRG